ncbi:MAG: PAS domain-containing protein [Nitrospiraceae bacterium]
MSRRASFTRFWWSMGDGVVVTDEEGRFVLANPALESILGGPPGAVPPSEWPERYGFLQADTVTPLSPQTWPLSRPMRGDKVDWAEIYLRRTDDPRGRWVSVTPGRSKVTTASSAATWRSSMTSPGLAWPRRPI